MEDEKKVIMNYPSNAHGRKEDTDKTEPKQEKVVKKVVKGKVIRKKKSFGKKLADVFIGEDVVNVREYVIYDVLIPAARATISDLFHGSVDMIFGEVRRSASRSFDRERGRSYVSYNQYATKRDRDRRDSRDKDRDRDRDRDRSRNRARHNFDDIKLDSRGEAEEVLSNLVDLIIDYGEATVSDFYTMVGIEEDYPDRKYGWKDLSTAYVGDRTRDGYPIILPRTVVLD